MQKLTCLQSCLTLRFSLVKTLPTSGIPNDIKIWFVTSDVTTSTLHYFLRAREKELAGIPEASTYNCARKADQF